MPWYTTEHARRDAQRQALHKQQPESSMSKWTFHITGLNIKRSFTCPTSNQARMFIWERLTEEQRARVVSFDLISEEAA